MPHRFRAVQCRSRVTGGHCTHVHTHACLCSLEDTPHLAQSFCVCLRPSSASWERIQVPCAKKSLYPYNRAILILHRSGQGTCGTCSSAEAEVHQQALGAQAAIQPGAQVMVQQLWQPPPRTAVLFGSLPAGTRLSKVPVQMSAYPALLQGGRLSGCQGLGGHWQTSLIQSSQDGLLPRMHMQEAWDSELRPLEGQAAASGSLAAPT